ncbi:EamA family transporter [Polynucleobacter paneuropaeus]|nr:EamA family transporter [Polynucleobacter paneuropaeus]
MNSLSFLIILTSVLLNAAAQLFLKAGTNAIKEVGFLEGGIVSNFFKIIFEFYILGGLGCYVFSVALWVWALSRVEVSIAYPMISIGYVVNFFAAWYLFGEVLSIQKLLGISVIILGVMIISRP